MAAAPAPHGRVVVAGAGVSGLALALALQTRGLEPLVLEAAPRAGGAIRTERESGYLCEWGPASLQATDPSVGALLDELGLEPLRASPAAHRRLAVAGGRLVPVPRTALGLARSPLLPWPDRLRALRDLVAPRGPAGRGEEESVAEFGRRRLGKVAAERILYPLVSGLYAGVPEEQSLPASFPALAAIERRSRSLLLGGAFALAEREGVPTLVSFREGMEELVAALAGRLGAARLRLGATVRRVSSPTSPGGSWRVTVEENGALAELPAAAVVLAVPSHAAAEIVLELDPALADAVARIRWVPVTLVYTGYGRAALPRPLDAYGFLVPPGERSRLLGGVFASSVWPGRAPAGAVLVAARLGGARAPELGAAGDVTLARLAHDELTALLGLREPPRFVKIVRHERGLPHYTLGHAARVEAIDAAERAHPGLYLTGNSYRGLGVPDCLRAARPLAERVAARLRAIG